MFRDLFIHLCIVISFLFVGGIVFKRNPYFTSLQNRLVLGVLAGFLGSLLMSFSFSLNDTTIMDLRHIAIVIAAYFGGVVPSVIAAAIIAVSRVLFFPISTASLLTFFVTLLIGLVIGIVGQQKIRDINRWFFMIIISTLLYALNLYVLIGSNHDFLNLMFYYWGFSLIAGFISFYLADYIAQSNYMFYDYKNQASTDYLTGLHNTRQFDESINTLLPKANKEQLPLVLFYIDIDYFKKVNDTYGHQTGDFVLKEVGNIINDMTRSQDLVFRNGGEEFSVLVSDTSVDQIYEIAERIRTKIESHSFVVSNQSPISVTVSIGIASNNSYSETTLELIEKADDALYKAKRTGRNRICVA
ncbi:diguanylate cyclase [Bacillus timonensis]|nr:diguanylate cyclase [Bacillus timonensis]